MRLQTPAQHLEKRERAKFSVLQNYGNDIWLPPHDGWERIAFQNARGIQRGKNPAEDVMEVMSDYDISVLGIAEPNCVINDNIKTNINARMKKMFGRGHASGSSMPRKQPGYLPGGILQFIQGNSAGRHVSSKSDKYGRFTWMNLHGKNNSKLCIITMYRVVQTYGTQPHDVESNTAYWQQVKVLIKEGKHRANPREEVLKSLSKLIMLGSMLVGR
mmetsp:Transcript_11381/g.24278  ORF Transcript_11381/g.24278 Transcript_11381/m.24278 type:complete len:216 (+) Transcript_11381:1201-1848(+)